jgi:hypothetical protein
VEGFIHAFWVNHIPQAGHTPVGLPPGNSKRSHSSMYLPLYVDARDVNEAQALIARFGFDAGVEAAERAEKSRNVGNHLHYCRWRQIERLVTLLNLETTLGTIH